VGSSRTVKRDVPVAFFGTPVAPDQTTLEDARYVITKYRLESRVPASVMTYLNNFTAAHETPKSLGPGVKHFVINRVPDSCVVAKSVCERMGIPALVLTTYLEGESREASTFLASDCREIQANEGVFKAPCILLAAGETTTRIDGLLHGLGGPSQELAVGFAVHAPKIPGCCLAAIDTDGTDGPTEVAGAIVDSETWARVRALGIDLLSTLRDHSTYSALKQLRDLIITGNTGTNLCDLNIVYIPSAKQPRLRR